MGPVANYLADVTLVLQGDEHAIRPAVILRVKQARISDSRSIKQRSTLCEMFQAQFIKDIGISILELIQIDILFDILILGS
jgi:hypothetical protein